MDPYSNDGSGFLVGGMIVVYLLLLCIPLIIAIITIVSIVKSPNWTPAFKALWAMCAWMTGLVGMICWFVWGKKEGNIQPAPSASGPAALPGGGFDPNAVYPQANQGGYGLPQQPAPADPNAASAQASAQAAVAAPAQAPQAPAAQSAQSAQAPMAQPQASQQASAQSPLPTRAEVQQQMNDGQPADGQMPPQNQAPGGPTA